MKNTKQSFWPLLWVMLFDHTSLNITFPVMTLIFFDAHSRLFAPDASQAVRSLLYGLCVAMPSMVNVIAAPILSTLSDEFGRRRILFVAISGALMYALTAAAGIFYGAISLLFFSAVLRGIFSRTNPIAQAAMGDISSKENKLVYMGYLQTAISIGASIGPFIGGYLANRYFFDTLNYSLPFFVAAGVAAIGCIVTLVIFKETLLEKRVATKWHEISVPSIKKVFANGDVLRISAILLLSQITWSMYYQYIPPVLKTSLNFDAHGLGIFVGLIAFWLALATTFGIRILTRFFSMRQILTISVYLVLLGTLLTPIFCALHWTVLVWLGAIPIAMGDVIAFSCITALYSDVVEKQEQGKVMGICFIVIGVIWALTAMLGGALMSITPLLPLYVAPIGIFFAIVLLHSKHGKTISF